MTCLQSAANNLPSLFTVAILVLFMGGPALLLWEIAMRVWQLQQQQWRAAGGTARALRGVLSGLVALAVQLVLLVLGWHTCSLDIPNIAGIKIWGVSVIFFGWMYFLSTLRPPLGHT
ncbi:MAG TPA: hypothetical protein VF510_01105 [Ktedonobacterales bacterium]